MLRFTTWVEFRAALTKHFGLTGWQVKSTQWACQQKDNEFIIAHFDHIDALFEYKPYLIDEEVLKVVCKIALVVRKKALMAFKA